MKKNGFSLMEMLVSISILAIMMLFLYKSYASLNMSNKVYKTKVKKLLDTNSMIKTLFLDFSLSLQTIKIRNNNKNEDMVTMQTSNSKHRNFNPYLMYILKNAKLYRLESLKPFSDEPLSMNDEFSIDEVAELETFRVYKNTKIFKNRKTEFYLVHMKFKETKQVLFKVKALNE